VDETLTAAVLLIATDVHLPASVCWDCVEVVPSADPERLGSTGLVEVVRDVQPTATEAAARARAMVLVKRWCMVVARGANPMP
jgi:hypothetical protein